MVLVWRGVAGWGGVGDRWSEHLGISVSQVGRKGLLVYTCIHCCRIAAVMYAGNECMASCSEKSIEGRGLLRVMTICMTVMTHES